MSNSLYEFSIIIPAFNEERFIGQCLESVAQLDRSGPSFEVIVVDNGSDDATVRIASEYSSRLTLSVVILPGARISELRNEGARRSSGTHLAFLDADCTVTSNWLSAAAHEFSSNPSCVLGGYCKTPSDMGWLGSWYDQSGLNTRRCVPFIPGAGIMIHRKHFFDVGGFDSTIQTSEDCEFCSRAYTAGIPSIAVASLAVTHHGWPRTVRVFFKKNRWHGTDVTRVVLRSYNYRSLRAVGFALFTDLFALLAVASAFTKSVRLLETSIMLWLLACAAIASKMSLKRRGLHTALILWPLVCIYAIARGSCLMDIRMWKIDRSARYVPRT